MTSSATKQIKRGGACRLRRPFKRSRPTGLLRFARNDDQGKKGSGTPTNVCPTSASRDAARALFSFPSPACGGGLGGGTLACRRSTAALASANERQRSAPGQASWDVAGRSILYGRSNRGAKTLRCSTGVTRARLSQSRERTSQTGHSAGRMMPKAAPARSAKPRGSTALAPCSGVPREHDPLSERDSMRANT